MLLRSWGRFLGNAGEKWRLETMADERCDRESWPKKVKSEVVVTVEQEKRKEKRGFKKWFGIRV
jgi:hypothetical protein